MILIANFAVGILLKMLGTAKSSSRDMTIDLRKSKPADLPFMLRMLYEAVFWRDPTGRPSFEEVLAFPEVEKALAGWGEREGDTAVIAARNSVRAGAAWIRYFTEDNNIRGYIEETTPVLVIGIHKDYRRLGIGTRLIDGLVDQAAEQGMRRISLAVSKDNVALNLYRKQGFVEHADIGDSFLMVREIQGYRPSAISITTTCGRKPASLHFVVAPSAGQKVADQPADGGADEAV